MGITVKQSKIHWNYFLALERDLEIVSRYVEFTRPNFRTFSIELAHLLFAAASEVDVVAKVLCEQIDPMAPRSNINDYKAILLPAIPKLSRTRVYVPRYGLDFIPWLNWRGVDNPIWWRSYNKVKHQRDEHFNEATLKNALNALGALLILTLHYYSRKLAEPPNLMLTLKQTTFRLEPQSVLLRLDKAFYHDTLVF